MNSPFSLPDSLPIGNLAAALAAAQGEMAGAKKDSANPFFKSRYADLASVWEACRETLSKHKLAVIQTTAFADGNLMLVTTLAHASGEHVSSYYPIQPAKERDPQALGSAMTYARRYSLAAMVGVAPEDDDGEAAMDRSRPPQAGASAPAQATKPKGLDEVVANAKPPAASAPKPAPSGPTKTWQGHPDMQLAVRVPTALPMWNAWADQPTGLGPFVDKGHDTWRKVSRGSLGGYRHKMLLEAVTAAEKNPAQATEYHQRAACTLAVLEWLSAHRGAHASTEPQPEQMQRETQEEQEAGLFAGR